MTTEKREKKKDLNDLIIVFETRYLERTSPKFTKMSNRKESKNCTHSDSMKKKKFTQATFQCEDENDRYLGSEDNHTVRFYAATSNSDLDLDVSTWGKSIASLLYATTHLNINDVIQHKNIIDHRRLKAREPSACHGLIIFRSFMLKT